MKAVIFSQHGGPEVLKYTEGPDPQIKANEVLVEVRACALNHLDVWVRAGLPGIKIPLPHILGDDVAGVVREAGELVTWTKPGDEVMVQPGVSCGHCEECLAGRDNMCDEYDMIGYRRDGGYGGLLAVPRRERDSKARESELAGSRGATAGDFDCLAHAGNAGSGATRRGCTYSCGRQRCRLARDSNRQAARRARDCYRKFR